MIAKETELLHWDCPDCYGSQELILVKGMELPEILECLDCGHKSPPLKYTDGEGGKDDMPTDAYKW